jgi:hypothetical protein
MLMRLLLDALSGTSYTHCLRKLTACCLGKKNLHDAGALPPWPQHPYSISHLAILRRTPTGRKHTRQTQNNTVGCICLGNTATRLHRASRRQAHERNGYLGTQAPLWRGISRHADHTGTMLLGASRDIELMAGGVEGMKRLCCACFGGWGETLASAVDEGRATTEDSVEGLDTTMYLGMLGNSLHCNASHTFDKFSVFYIFGIYGISSV